MSQQRAGGAGSAQRQQQRGHQQLSSGMFVPAQASSVHAPPPEFAESHHCTVSVLPGVQARWRRRRGCSACGSLALPPATWPQWQQQQQRQWRIQQRQQKIRRRRRRRLQQMRRLATTSFCWTTPRRQNPPPQAQPPLSRRSRARGRGRSCRRWATSLHWMTAQQARVQWRTRQRPASQCR